MGARLGVIAPAEQSPIEAASGSESGQKKRYGAGKDGAAENQTGATDASGVSKTGPANATGDCPTVGSKEPTTATVKKPLYDQCGLEDDSDEWEEWQGPERIRTSQLTAEERAKFKGHLDQIFSYDTAILGVRYVFEPEDVLDVMQKVIPYLESEPVLIDDVPFPINIVGDLYGQLYDLHRIFRHDEKDDKPGWECRKFIFLGNYVDKGRQSLEIIMALFCIKMLYPDDIFLLRGGHEFLATNYDLGLYQDMKDRYTEETAKELYLRINSAFSYLSIAAILGTKYFCAHGGISPEGFTRANLKSMTKPIISSKKDTLYHDVVWAEPLKGLNSFAHNPNTNSVYFGLAELCRGLSTMEVKAIFRAGTLLKNGYAVTWSCCITIFSATDLGGTKGNKGAVARLNEKGLLSFDVLEVSERRHLWERELRRLANDEKAKKEAGTAHVA